MMENENPSENPAKDPKASFYEKVLNIRNDILSGKIQPTKEEHEAMSNCYENVILQTGIGAGLFFIASNTFIRQKQMKPSTKGALLTSKNPDSILFFSTLYSDSFIFPSFWSFRGLYWSCFWIFEMCDFHYEFRFTD
eukprot:Sdes_comp17174_c0_seq3m6343